MKNFDEWNNIKKNIEKFTPDFNVDMREVWWVSLGINIGSEACGKNDNFERPVIVLKKFDSNNFFVLPITSTINEGDHFYTIFMNGQDRCVMLHQGKFINKRRFLRRMQILSESKFDGIKNTFIDLISNDYVKNDFVKIENPPKGGNSQAPYGGDNNIISDRNLLSNEIAIEPADFRFVRVDKRNYEKYLEQLVLVDQKFNQAYIDNKFADFLTPKQNSEIDFKKFIVEEINSDEEYFYEIVMEKTNYLSKDEKVIGYVLCFLKDKSIVYKESKVGYIDGVYVDEVYRGRGLGKLLMSHAEEFCKSKDVFNISLSSKVKNTKAIRLYKELGFVEQDVKMFKRINL